MEDGGWRMEDGGWRILAIGGRKSGVSDQRSAISPLAYMRGDLTPRAVALVIEWAMLHLGELSVCWQLAREMKPIPQIAPLE
jgi:hypothetical protein